MYGFSVRGNKGNLIISDETPVLTQAYTGALVVNGISSQPGAAYGYCNITYPVAVSSSAPPMIFAVPTAGAVTAGLGLFCHRGSPGAWTGFSVMIARDVMLQNGAAMVAGFDSGWQYRVCGFGIAGENGYDSYGLRIYDKLGDVLYDSAWPIVKFLGLMSAWTLTGFTRGYATGSYWEPNFTYDEDDIDYDMVLAKGTHVWDSPNLSKGLLMSSLGLVNSRVDMGSRDKSVSAITFVGFNSSGRSTLQAVSVFGKSQHAGGDIGNMSRWNLLTADFTGI